MIDVLLMCLALNVYHEARGEPLAGQYAVAHVTMNRVADKRWPMTVCEVVGQEDQFSWVGRVNPLPADDRGWRLAVSVAQDVINGHPDNTNFSTHFHHVNLSPSWATEMVKTMEIGNHVFYY
jgi:spore germination cell wall hydrolase CwlJ-like protein